MAKYLAIYTGTATATAASGWNALSPEERQAREAAGMTAWGEWMAANAGRIVDAGGPLGKTRRISADGIAEVTNNVTGYVVIEAESHEAAARLFESHPHFSIFPGEAVEVMSVLPIPGQ
jgi:hypothetical protein